MCMYVFIHVCAYCHYVIIIICTHTCTWPDSLVVVILSGIWNSYRIINGHMYDS